MLRFKCIFTVKKCQFFVSIYRLNGLASVPRRTCPIHFFQFLQSFSIMNFNSKSVLCSPRAIRPIHKIYHTLQFPHGISTNGSIQGTFVNASIITSSTLLREQVHEFTLTDKTYCIYSLKSSFLCDTIFFSRFKQTTLEQTDRQVLRKLFPDKAYKQKR